MNKKHYTDYSEYLSRHFDCKVQKISVNAGFTCPNRDGSKGVGGCTYCNNQTFSPAYCRPKLTVQEQLAEGKRFFGNKYPKMKYLAYFQSYTNTYGDIADLQRLYEGALEVDGVVGIVIATRPDCVTRELLEYLGELGQRTKVTVEYGVETANDKTLELVNRGHSWADSVKAIAMTHDCGVDCGAHLILGLPDETEDDMMRTVEAVAELPLSTLKFHQMQVVRGTKLAKQVELGEVCIAQWTAAQYIELCAKVIERVPRQMAIDRFVSQSPAELLISPKWGLKNYEFTNLLDKYLEANGVFQGSRCKRNDD